MDTHDTKMFVHWSSGLNIVAGLWLVLAPHVFGYTEVASAIWNDAAVGVVVFVLAVIRTMAPLQFENISWTNVVIGSWLFFAPWILGYPEGIAATWNDLIVGAIIVSLASWSAITTHDRTE
tara:strand:- start:1033 stop:1395 length:363 start_codon:yes stop_codon:yes gene_type:complete